VEPLLELLDRARGDVDLTFDQYPWGAGSTTLAALLPPWAQAGGPDATLARLADADQRARMARDARDGLPGWENLYGACGPERVFVAHAAPSRAEAIGRSLAEIAEERACDPYVAALDVLADTALDVTMVDHYAQEDAVRAIFRHPLGLVGSDGIFGTRPHPRLYATAARVLGRYALRERLISVDDAVARLTDRPARRLGLADRGRIAEGLRADLVLLDPREYVDTATFEDSKRTPPGVHRTIVAGETVWADGAPTGAQPGGVIRDPLPH
jgi:N-acyl-D-amino-acid deacylase